jgi:hypothetical protein
VSGKRIAAALLLLCSLALPGGCSRFIEGEYVSVTKHEEPVELMDSEGQYYEVRTYVGMKNALYSLISSAMETGTIRVTDYSGSVEDDISRACLDATRDYPLGAYAVDYISHSVNRILGYQEIGIRIRYRLMPEEIAAVRQAITPADLYTMLENSALIGRTHLAVQISSLAVTEESVTGCIDSYYRKHPELLSSRPGVEVTFGPEEGAVTKTLDLSSSYQDSRETAAERLSALDEIAAAYASEYEGYPREIAALLCCQAVAQSLQAPGPGDTAYDALVLGASGSEGCAMAFQLLCNRCGLDCQVIEGRAEGNTRCWNLIRLENDYYHVDCLACAAGSVSDGFLLADADMVLRYWWDVDKYPSCNGSLTAKQVVDAYLSGLQELGKAPPEGASGGPESTGG